MIYPNYECYQLCVWMLTISSQRLTGSQITVTQNIQAAALAQTGVTENEWNNFNEYAAWRNPYYLVYRDYQSGQIADLLTDLDNYYKMDGNSNDSVGSINGTDTSITYNNSYGIINQGARNSNTSAKIEFGAVTDFTAPFITGIFTINFWFKAQVAASTYYLLSSSQGGSNKGIKIQITLTGDVIIWITNGLGGSSVVFTGQQKAPFNDLNWHMITLMGDGTSITALCDNVIFMKGLIGTFGTGNASFKLTAFYWAGVTGSPTMYIDEFGYWSRALNHAELSALYNSGSGLTYPF